MTEIGFIGRFWALLAKVSPQVDQENLNQAKDHMVNTVTNGRQKSLKGLSVQERETIIRDLELRYRNSAKGKAEIEELTTKRRKVIGLLREAGYEIYDPVKLTNVADMKRIYEWVIKYGHARFKNGRKKGFNRYNSKELDLLITNAAKVNKHDAKHFG
jgi:hypothetical protein